MWKALTRDVACFVAAAIVVSLIGSALWLGASLWLLPRTEDSIKWVYLAFLGPAVVVPASVGALLYALVRGRARRGGPITAPYWRDTFVVPLTVGLALGLAFLAAAVATGHNRDLGAAFLIGLAQAVPLALAVWLVVLVQRLSSRPARVLSVAAAALVVLLAGGRWALDVRGGRIFQEYKAAAQGEIAAERQRLASERQPVLFGTPIDDNAADRYRRLTQKIGDGVKGSTAAAASAALRSSLGTPSSPEVTQALETHQPELQALREAVRCTHCDWRFAWERGFNAPLPNFLGTRLAADLLGNEARQHAVAGDLAGAVERDLEVIRMGCDYESSGALIGVLIAFAVEGNGIDALLQVVTDGGLPVSPDWDLIGSKLDILEPHLAALSVGYRGERLAYVGWEPLVAKDPSRFLAWPSEPNALDRAFDLVVPSRFMVADSVRIMNATLREAEWANDLADPREAKRLTKAAFDRALPSLNPMVQMGLPSLAHARASQDFVTARLRLLRAAIQLEKRWQQEGRYPGNVADLPIDPFAYPAKLHYMSLADGKGYRIWSVGLNGKDDGGVAKDRADVAFERSPRAPSAQASKPRLWKRFASDRR